MMRTRVHCVSHLSRSFADARHQILVRRVRLIAMALRFLFALCTCHPLRERFGQYTSEPGKRYFSFFGPRLLPGSAGHRWEMVHVDASTIVSSVAAVLSVANSWFVCFPDDWAKSGLVIGVIVPSCRRPYLLVDSGRCWPR